MGKAITKPLNVLERKELRKHEAVIKTHLEGFLEVGNALFAIQEGELYRETHKTFNAYYKDKFGLDKTHAYRLIAAATVVSKLSPMGDVLPTNERQARELIGMEPKAAKDVMEEVAEEAAAEGAPITATAIREKRELFEADNEPYVKPPDEPDEPEEEAPEPTVEEAMAASNKALESLAREITALHKKAEGLDEPHLEDGKASRLDTLLSQLKAAAGTVRAAKGHAVCSYCDGKGCKPCRKSGWLTKTASESAPRKE